MTSSVELLMQIENLRDTMHQLIDADQHLLNPNILSMSQRLDQLLNQFHDLKSIK